MVLPTILPSAPIAAAPASDRFIYDRMETVSRDSLNGTVITNNGANASIITVENSHWYDEFPIYFPQRVSKLLDELEKLCKEDEFEDFAILIEDLLKAEIERRKPKEPEKIVKAIRKLDIDE